MPHNNWTDTSYIVKSVQQYAKSLRILGVYRIGIIPNTYTAFEPRHLPLMVEMKTPLASTDKLVAVKQLLEWLLHTKVDMIPPHLLNKDILAQVTEIPLR